MECKQHWAKPQIQPRIIIHGGAGNLTPANLPPDKYNAYREALLSIVWPLALSAASSLSHALGFFPKHICYFIFPSMLSD